MSNIPDPVCQPDLLNFEETTDKWADLSDDDKRQRIVDMLDAVANFGLHDTPAGRRDAYGDIIAPGETASRRAELLEKNTGNSSCGLLVRTLWRMAGAKDDGQHLLDPPNVPGLVITNILKYAGKTEGAVTKPKPGGDGFDPKPGDVLYIVGGGSQHIFTIYSIDDSDDDTITITSVDGGQNNPKAGVDDGGCNGIQRKTRKLVKKTLTFQGDPHNRVIVDWIDTTKLPFTEPVVKLTKGMSDDDVK